MITEADTRNVLNVFLKEHPEHIQGVKVIDGHSVMDTETFIAFTHWSVKIGVTPKATAERFLERVNNRKGQS